MTTKISLKVYMWRRGQVETRVSIDRQNLKDNFTYAVYLLDVRAELDVLMTGKN